MADAKTSAPPWVAAMAVVEKLTTKWQQELIAIRDEALRNKQFCVEMATSCGSLATAALVVMKQIDNEFRELIERTERELLEVTPTKRTPTKPAKRSRQS
jgi:hypothetical protein